MRKILIAALSFILTACTYTTNYTPEEYVIAAKRIPAFSVKGKVVVENKQDNSSKVTFFSDGPATYVGDYKTVTQHLADQLSKEIINLGNVTSNEPQKTITVSITSLNAVTEYWVKKSRMQAKVVLGNGKEIFINITQNGQGGASRTLNGTIALGVIDILKNPEVISYLSN